MEITINKYQEYLKLFYKDANDRDLFNKLIEEIGELAVALNKKYGLKKGEFDINNLGDELVDVLYFTTAIAVANNIDLQKVLIKKDKEGSIRYNRGTNLEEYIKSN